jgi:hypothetical protein
MYVSRMTFHVHPGKTSEVQQALAELEQMVASAGGTRPRVLRSHMASAGAPDVVFEQQSADLGELEQQIHTVTSDQAFQLWSSRMSPLLAESPKREIYEITSGDTG